LLLTDQSPGPVVRPVGPLSFSHAKVWKLYSVEPSILSIQLPFSMPHIFALSYAQIPSLRSRCEDANKRFFRSSSRPSSGILSLLPPHRDSTITSRLRSTLCSYISSASWFRADSPKPDLPKKSYSVSSITFLVRTFCYL